MQSRNIASASLAQPEGLTAAFGLESLTISAAAVYKIDAGIVHAVVLDQDIVLVSGAPASIQTIRWCESGSNASRLSSCSLKDLPWFDGNDAVARVEYDKSMNLFVWITRQGHAYAVRGQDNAEPKNSTSLAWHGHLFYRASGNCSKAELSAINARFSLIALAQKGGTIAMFSIKDHVGNITPSRRVLPSSSGAGPRSLTALTWTADGHALLRASECAWCISTVYGHITTSSTNVSNTMNQHVDTYLSGAGDAAWLSRSHQLLLIPPRSRELWVLDIVTLAIASSYSNANIARSLMIKSSSLMFHPDPPLSKRAGSMIPWHHVPLPPLYLARRSPLRHFEISIDGRYIAVAGSRGLAHFSTASSRWKVFADVTIEESFRVRGGMCWYQHILLVAVESGPESQVSCHKAILDRHTEHCSFVSTLGSRIWSRPSRTHHSVLLSSRCPWLGSPRCWCIRGIIVCTTSS